MKRVVQESVQEYFNHVCRLAELEVLHLRVLHGQLILDIDGDNPFVLYPAPSHVLCVEPVLHSMRPNRLAQFVLAGLVLDSPKLKQLVVTAGILAISCSPDESEDQVRVVTCQQDTAAWLGLYACSRLML